MNEITIDTSSLPVVCEGGFLVASEPFYHIDRTAAFNVLIYVTNGQIFVTEDDIDYTINSGEMLFLKSGVHHCGKRLIKQGTAWYYVHFYLPECMADEPFSLSAYARGEAAKGEKMLYSTQIAKKSSGLSGSKTEAMLKEFVSDLSSPLPIKRWGANAMLHGILSQCAFAEKPCRSVTQADKIADFLQQSIHLPFSSENLEKQFFLSYKYMAALFKNSTGVTMQQYHNRLRMEEAGKLLRSTLMTIGEISANLGFSDMLYFSRCFHAYSGMSPTEYRRKIPFSE